MHLSRLHHRWIPRAVYLSWLPPDVLRQLEQYLEKRDLDSLEEALMCRSAPRRSERGYADRALLMGRDLLIAECRLRGQYAAPRVTVLQSLRTARAARDATGSGSVQFKSFLEWLPVGLLDAYLPYESLEAVERALAPPDEPWELWDPDAEEDASGLPVLCQPSSAIRASGTPRLSGRQKQWRGQVRRARRQNSWPGKPWSLRK